MTPLERHVYTHPRIALRLVKAGADVNVADPDGVQPLQKSLARDFDGDEARHNLVRELIKAGADVHAHGVGGAPCLHSAFDTFTKRQEINVG